MTRFPRFTTAASAVLDHDTIASADKFGNIFVLRLDSSVAEQAAVDRGGQWDLRNLGGAPHKLDQICQYHVGEVITSMHKVSLAPGRSEAIVYATVSGALGAVMPFLAADDVEFFSHLEMHMRQEVGVAGHCR